ncbi:MAG: phosphatase PAP2 family protein [Tissierellia bacterium]|nr:phosphatase PAP2 family protein [Tissierellia bacterium]
MKRQILIIILLAIFITLGLMVRGSSDGILFDHAILESIHNNIDPTLVDIMKFISFLGSYKFLVPAVGFAVIISIINRRYFVAKFLILNSLGSFVFNHLLKLVFQRTRPLDYFLVEQGGLSFPSGHSMVSMSLCLAIAYLLTREERSKRKRISAYTLAVFFALVMGLSRIYLGVHWPTDILGGFIMGYIFYNLSKLFLSYGLSLL